jgi:hypothetical protein
VLVGFEIQSFTARKAFEGGAHLLWDEAPKIFEDTFALRLCGCESEAALRAWPEDGGFPVSFEMEPGQYFRLVAA